VAFVPVCSVDPGPDTACPSGSLTWVTDQSLSAFPELTSAEIGQISSAILVLFVVAFGVRLLLKLLHR